MFRSSSLRDVLGPGSGSLDPRPGSACNGHKCPSLGLEILPLDLELDRCLWPQARCKFIPCSLASGQMPTVFCVCFFFNMYLFGCSWSQLRHEGSQLQCMRSNSLTWAPCIGAKSLNHWTTREVSWMSCLELGSASQRGKITPINHRESPVPSTCSVTSTPHTASL